MVNKKKISQLLLFALVTLLIFSTCLNRKGKEMIDQIIKDYDLSELFNIALTQENNDDDFTFICNVINDSISMKNNTVPYALRTVNVINEKDNLTEHEFIDCSEAIPHFSEKYTFKIKLEESFLIIENDTLYDTKEISNFASAFMIRTHENCSYYFEKEIDYFGIVKIPKGGFLISIQLDKNGNLSQPQFRLLKQCVAELFDANSNRLNEISQQKWKVHYNSISLKRKEAVTDVANFLLFVVFNHSH